MSQPVLHFQMLTQCFMLGKIIWGYLPWKLWQKCHHPGSAMAPWSIVSQRLHPCKATLTQKSCRPLCSEWWFCRDSSSPDINQQAVCIHGRKLSNLPDINSDHVLTVGLLDHIVDGVAAHKRYVDVVPRYQVCVVVVYRVYEHDVCIIRGLRKEN